MVTIQQVPLRFVSTGYGNGVSANLVLAVLNPDSAPNKRLVMQAKKDKRYLDMTCGNGVGTALFMVDGRVVGCAPKPKTMMARLNAPDYDDSLPDE